METRQQMVAALEQRRAGLVDDVVRQAEFVPGSYAKASRRCGKKTCHCTQGGKDLHLRWVWTWYEVGQRKKQTIRVDQIDEIKCGVDRWQSFKATLDQLIKVNAELAQLHLQESVGR